MCCVLYDEGFRRKGPAEVIKYGGLIIKGFFGRMREFPFCLHICSRYLRVTILRGGAISLG